MNALQELITSSMELGSARTIEVLGLSSGEISQRRAAKVYGKWFTDAVLAGQIRPARVEDGKAGTRWFRVADILKEKVRQAAVYEIKLKSLQ